MNSSANSNILHSGKILFMNAPITLLSNNIFIGCNQYHSSSVIRQNIDFGELTSTTSEIAGPDFAQSFLDRFLSLKSFLPQNGIKDEFIANLHSSDGLHFQEILLEAILAVEASIAFAMHELSSVSYAAISKHQLSSDLIWGISDPRLSREAARIALLGLVDSLPNNLLAKKSSSLHSFDQEFNQLIKLANRRRLAPSTSIIKLAAKKRGIPCEMLGRQHLLLGQGKLQHQMYASMTATTSIAAQKVCADKRQTNKRLTALRLPVPQQVKVGSVKGAHTAVNKIGFPLVIKPLKGKKGRGVTANLTSSDYIEHAFKCAHQSGSDVLVESFIPGGDFRLLVIGGKFVAAVNRQPPKITGDGETTITTLIDKLNTHPYRDGFRGFPVEKDAELNHILNKASLAMDDVLSEGRELTLRAAANVSTGGIPIDVTELVHADNRKMAERAATGVGLDIAGVDFLTTDITRSYREVGGAIVEINARPGLDIHIWPMVGKMRSVVDDILELSFPANANGRIPIVAVSGDKGTGTTARTLDMILRGAGRSVALTLRLQAFVNGKSAELSKRQQAQAPLVLLRDPEIDSLVSTVSLRQTAKSGLLIDSCMLTIILDRAKEGGAESFYKGIDIIGRATTDCFVVGAGNAMALSRISPLSGKRLILVGERFNDPGLQTHLKAGHEAVTTMWHEDKLQIALVSGKKVSATFDYHLSSSNDGKIRKQRLNRALMYAIAAAYGLGLSVDVIMEALADNPTIVLDSD